MEGNYVLHNALKRFAGGDEIRAYAYMGCHEELRRDRQGYVFRLWAPKAQSVSLVGDWNGWDPQAEPMTYMEYGVWEVFSTEPKLGQAYIPLPFPSVLSRRIPPGSPPGRATAGEMRPTADSRGSESFWTLP